MHKVKATEPQPVFQPKIVSPMCLIQEHKGPCTHNHCLMAYKKPQWYGISIVEFYNRYDFSEFTVIRSSYGHPHIIPKNPNPDTKDNFEMFRQSMDAICYLAGSWPDINTVAKADVEFRWAEHIDRYPMTNYETGKTDWKQRFDVAEYAYYVGSIDTTFQKIDINAIFELPEQLRSEIDLTTKDWCHCGSESDWCGEGCYQPQNKEAVLKMEKGNCNGK